MNATKTRLTDAEGMPLYLTTWAEFMSKTSPAEQKRIGKLPGFSTPAFQRNEIYADRDFTGVRNYGEAHQMASIGNYLSPFALRLRDTIKTHVRIAPVETTFADVTGSSNIDVGAFNTGDPECVMNFKHDEGKNRKAVTLIHNSATSSAINKEVISLRGQAFMALVDALEMSKQYRTEVYYSNCTRGQSTFVKLKEFGQDYDPQAMGFALCHPAMLRILTFAFWDATAPYLLQVQQGIAADQGRGRPAPVRQLPEEVTGIQMEGAHVWDVPNAHSIHDEPSAIEWLMRQLGRYGIANSFEV
jgi:hypothetical protein